MRQIAFRRYTNSLFAVAAGTLLVVLVGNAVVNPFNLYEGPRFAGVNDYKYELARHSRLSKAAEVRRVRPQCLVLGSSRAQVGLDPSHPAWTGCRAYNLAHNGGTLYEALRYLQHAAALERPREIVLALDFLMFNVYRPLQQPGYIEERLLTAPDGSPNPVWRRTYAVDLFSSLLSWHAVQASWRTVFPEYLRRPGGPEDGYWEYTRLDAGFVSRRGQRAAFHSNELAFLTEHWFPPPRRRFVTTDPDRGRDTYEYLRAILRIAHREGAGLRMLISPAHARQWEALDQAGLWPQFEDWKRTLVRINVEEARRAGHAPYPLWDFSGFNSYTTEEVPPAGDRATMMQWYWESSHYRKELGDRVLDRVLGFRAAGREVAGDFGIEINERNIEEWLVAVRAARERWRRVHPQDVAELTRLVRSTASWRMP